MNIDDKYKTSATLIGRVQNGDEEAWHDLVELYHNLLVHWIRKEGIQDEDTVNDLAQQVLIAVRRRIDTFTLRPGLRSWRPWIRKIAKMKAYDFFRKRTRENDLIERVKENAEREQESEQNKSLLEMEAGIDEDDKDTDDEERAILMQSTIDVLHERTKISKRDLMIFYQCTCTDREYADIAKEFQLETGNVATIKSRVMVKIKGNERYTAIAQLVEIGVRKRSNPDA